MVEAGVGGQGGGNREGGQEEFYVDSAFEPLPLMLVEGLLLHIWSPCLFKSHIYY